MNYEPVIGLEVHVQIKTKSKAFCGCSTEFGAEPNSQVCPVCLGFPGSLPVLNASFLDAAIKVAVALGCQVQEFTKFDRKHYFYPDLPKNYQISQYDLPLALNGFVDIELESGAKRIRVKRVHLEEDAGKLIHADKMSLVDFNRTGMPLLEIVSEPDLYSPQEAYEYLNNLKSILSYLDISDCDMEKGSLRCDANISVRPKGEEKLGIKSELKNLNSFRAVRDSLTYEIERQVGALGVGEKIIQETRLWDDKESKTYSMRSKGEAKDYRYFPDPDLPPFIIKFSKVDEIRKALPELPKEKQVRLMRDFGLSEYDAGILVFSKKDAEYSEDCMRKYPKENKKQVANLLIGPLLSEANNRNCRLVGLDLSAENLLELIDYVDSNKISHLTAKIVLTEMIDTKKKASVIIQEKNLVQISDTSSLNISIEEVIKENDKSVQDFKNGKENALMFLVGQVMKKTKGKANPKILQELLRGRLKDA